MIINFIGYVLYFFIFSVVSLLPNTGLLPESFSNALNALVDILQSWQSVIPVFDDLFIIIALMLSIETGIITLVGVNWVINKVRGSG